MKNKQLEPNEDPAETMTNKNSIYALYILAIVTIFIASLLYQLSEPGY